jgi:hypothetical protein
LPSRTTLSRFPEIATSRLSSSVVIAATTPRRAPPRRAPPRREAPLRCAALLRRAAPPRRDAPPRHMCITVSRSRQARSCRRPPLTDVHLPDAAHLLPDSLPLPALGPPPRAAAPCHRSSIWYLQPVCRAATAAATCRPPCAAAGRRACALMAGRAARWGLALLSPAREMLTSASIFN